MSTWSQATAAASIHVELIRRECSDPQTLAKIMATLLGADDLEVTPETQPRRKQTQNAS